jgi:transcriptional regulator with XRE-family HTH domain
VAVRPSPTVRSRRLRHELVRLRKAHGLTIEQAAARSGGELVTSTVGRWENGDRIPRPSDLRILLDVYDVRGRQREALLTLAREAKQKGWWYPHRDMMKAGFDIFIGLEAEAAEVRTFQSLLLPGLLHTESYARAVITAININAAAEEVDRLASVRMARKERLTEENSLRLWAVLDEALLRRTVGGPDVMADQLAHLLEMSKLPNVTIQVIPNDAGAHAAMEGPFYVLQFPEASDTDVAYVEQGPSGLVLEGEGDVRAYTLHFGQLAATALTPDKSEAFIANVAAANP